MKMIWLLITVVVLQHSSIMLAGEPAPIIQGESHQAGEFCIQIAGALSGFTGYLHSSQPFTLEQAIQAAGGFDEWAGNIKIYSIERLREGVRQPTILIHMHEYKNDAQVRDELLPNGARVQVEKMGSRSN